MKIALQPGEQFTIVRQLSDHTDTSTYYVSAVIRNSLTDEIIDTVRLTDKTGRRFSKVYEVPADVSGLGFYIDITTTVYDDSGYSSKASAYGEENDQYLVLDRTKGAGGGGSGADVDYKKIEKIITKTITDTQPAEKISLEPVLNEIRAVMVAVQAIEIPEIEELELSPVLKAIDNSLSTTLKAIDNKEVTEMPDMTPLKSEILDAIDKKEPNLDEVFKKIEKLLIMLDQYVKYDMSREKRIQETVVISEQKKDRAKSLLGQYVKYDISQGKLRELSEKILSLFENSMAISEQKKDRAKSLL